MTCVTYRSEESQQRMQAEAVRAWQSAEPGCGARWWLRPLGAAGRGGSRVVVVVVTQVFGRW